MTGLLENAVDEEGWTYAVDFAWINWPPGPGNGRFRKVTALLLPQQPRRRLLASRTELSAADDSS